MGKKDKAEVETEVAEETKDPSAKVGAIHEGHAAYLKDKFDVDVDPLHIFMVYSTRVDYRKNSTFYAEAKERREAAKAEALEAKEAAKAEKAKEREAKKAEKEAAKAAKAEEAAKAKAAEEKKAAAEEKKSKASTKASSEKPAAKGKGKGKPF